MLYISGSMRHSESSWLAPSWRHEGAIRWRPHDVMGEPSGGALMTSWDSIRWSPMTSWGRHLMAPSWHDESSIRFCLHDVMRSAIYWVFSHFLGVLFINFFNFKHCTNTHQMTPLLFKYYLSKFRGGWRVSVYSYTADATVGVEWKNKNEIHIVHTVFNSVGFSCY